MRRLRRGIFALAWLLSSPILSASIARATTAAVDGNGNLVIDGQPFLPIGM